MAPAYSARLPQHLANKAWPWALPWQLQAMLGLGYLPINNMKLLETTVIAGLGFGTATLAKVGLAQIQPISDLAINLEDLLSIALPLIGFVWYLAKQEEKTNAKLTSLSARLDERFDANACRVAELNSNLLLLKQKTELTEANLTAKLAELQQITQQAEQYQQVVRQLADYAKKTGFLERGQGR